MILLPAHLYVYNLCFGIPRSVAYAFGKGTNRSSQFGFTPAITALLGCSRRLPGCSHVRFPSDLKSGRCHYDSNCGNNQFGEGPSSILGRGFARLMLLQCVVATRRECVPAQRLCKRIHVYQVERHISERRPFILIWKKIDNPHSNHPKSLHQLLRNLIHPLNRHQSHPHHARRQ